MIDGRGNNRIALFLPSLGGGGAERVMVTLASGFADRGLDTDLVLGQAAGPYLAEVSPEVRVVDLGCGRVLSAIPRLARYLRSEEPLALLSTLDYANVAAMWARRLSGTHVPVVIREANTISRAATNAHNSRRRFVPFLMRKCYPHADKIVAVSQGVADDLVTSLGIPSDTIRVIYNPVLTPGLTSRAQEPVAHPWFNDGESPVIVGVGRLNVQKDFATLLRAFAVVSRAMGNARLAILGEGEDRDKLEKLARELGVEEHLWLPGFVGNPYPYLARASVFVLSSAWEGLPNVLIQAMALGAPVVSTDCQSGPREILEEGKLGRLTPVGDADALAAAILDTLQSKRCDNVKLPDSLARFELNTIVSQYLETMLGADWSNGRISAMAS